MANSYEDDDNMQSRRWEKKLDTISKTEIKINNESKTYRKSRDGIKTYIYFFKHLFFSIKSETYNSNRICN